MSWAFLLASLLLGLQISDISASLLAASDGMLSYGLFTRLILPFCLSEKREGRGCARLGLAGMAGFPVGRFSRQKKTASKDRQSRPRSAGTGSLDDWLLAVSGAKEKRPGKRLPALPFMAGFLGGSWSIGQNRAYSPSEGRL